MTHTPWIPRAVIFDFDGVIADTEPLHSETFRRVLAEEDIHLTDDDHGERFLGVNDRAGFAKAFAEVSRDISAARIEALLERKSSYFRAGLEAVQLFPGVRELVGGLAGRLLLGIASGGRGREIAAVLRQHGIRERFAVVVSADEVPQSKPAPDLYLAAWRQLVVRAADGGTRLTPADCLAIEDSLHGIEAALAAGMRCVGVAHSFPVEQLGRASLAVQRLEELTPESILAGRVS
jgi:beta-phosphoglucomutase-like phosphatase (HAD superfamily)